MKIPMTPQQSDEMFDGAVAAGRAQRTLESRFTFEKYLLRMGAIQFPPEHMKIVRDSREDYALGSAMAWWVDQPEYRGQHA